MSYDPMSHFKFIFLGWKTKVKPHSSLVIRGVLQIRIWIRLSNEGALKVTIEAPYLWWTPGVMDNTMVKIVSVRLNSFTFTVRLYLWRSDKFMVWTCYDNALLCVTCRSLFLHFVTHRGNSTGQSADKWGHCLFGQLHAMGRRRSAV